MTLFPKTRRILPYLLLATAAIFPLALVSCSGGGSASAPGGQATVGLSLSSAAGYPAGTTFASASPADILPSATTAAQPPAFDNLLVSVTRIALIRTSGPGAPDANGQVEEQDGTGDDSPGASDKVTAILPSPVAIDLLHPPTPAQAAKLLNRFDSVPAGSYGKIRLHYDNVVGYSGGVATPFHPTAHYHFDIHFVGGKLVIPVAADPSGGVRFFSVAIRLVGLKYHQTGNGSVLLRPQVFAQVDGVKYLVSGVARNVDPASKTFDVLAADGRTIRAAWDPVTSWFMEDGRLVDVTSGAASGILRDRAAVDVAGAFGSTGAILADEVDVSFPDAASGTVDTGWRADNTFLLRRPSDNVAVAPQPSRARAYYDNAAFPFAPLPDNAVAAGAPAKARGYLAAGFLEAFWISIGP